jgi:hypothetical protein
MDFKKEGLPPPTKKISNNVTPTLKKIIWDMYVGIGKQEALCGLCGINRIKNNTNSGFEAAHVIARGFLTEELTVYYLYPSCSVCNNECKELCVFDFLYARQRIVELRKAIMIIYKRYITEHEHELEPQDRLAHLILDHLYGPKRFPAGGGIQNTKQIYEIARSEQYEYLREQTKELERQLGEIQIQRSWLWDAVIKPMRLQ